ncbi:chitinase, partial [Trinickia terrae]
MTTQSNPEPPLINFAFPFRDAKGKEIVDEHVFYEWLADEESGSFAVSSSGMWHGGIHVSAEGAGKHLDLPYGVRCIAAGEVIAYQTNRLAL